MTTVKTYCYWIDDFDVDYDKPVELYVDNYPTTPMPEGTVRICVSHEPHPQDSAKAFVHPEYYTYLLTYKECHLHSIPNAVLFIAHDTRVIDYTIKEKEYGVSTVVGFKGEFVGQVMRHALWWAKESITIPKRFYLSGDRRWNVDYTDQLVLSEDSKDALWDTQFHICIENVPMNNLFTEKIIDCFISKTVPIYIGAPNIGKYFNVNGIVVCKNLADIIEKTNALTTEDYERMKPFIEENYLLAHNWIPHLSRLKSKVTELLNLLK